MTSPSELQDLVGPGFDRDPYDGLPVEAVRPMTHAPDDICRFAVPHPRELCKHVNPMAPVTAAELMDVPAALAQPEPAAPWE